MIRKRKRTANFVQISNIPIQDSSLSWEARGMLTYLMSLPEDWEISQADLVNRCRQAKRSKTSRIFNELIKAGYIVKERERQEAGKFKGFVYLVDDVKQNLPKSENQLSVGTEVRLSEVGFSEVGKSDTIKETSFNKETKRKRNSNVNTQLINAIENNSANTRAKPDLEKPNQSINAHESFAFSASASANVNDGLVKDDFNEKSITPPAQKSDAAIKAFQAVSFNFAQTAISTLESKYKMSPADALARWGETGIKDAFLDAAEVMKQSTSRIPYRWADILAHAATAKTAKTISETPVNPNAESKVDYYEGYEVRSSYEIAIDGNYATPYRLEGIYTRGSKLSRLSFLALDDQSYLTLTPSDIESGSVHVSSLS